MNKLVNEGDLITYHDEVFVASINPDKNNYNDLCAECDLNTGRYSCDEIKSRNKIICSNDLIFRKVNNITDRLVVVNSSSLKKLVCHDDICPYSSNCNPLSSHCILNKILEIKL